MIPRLPEEDEGEFYRLLPEGVYDGAENTLGASHFYIKNDHFTKTGSGQTHRKVPGIKRRRSSSAGWDGEGDPIGAKQGLGGLDGNRQYPRGYIPEGTQPGAGSTPMHLVEVEAHIKAVTERNNICVSLSYHTTGREILHVCQVSDCPGSVRFFSISFLLLSLPASIWICSVVFCSILLIFTFPCQQLSPHAGRFVLAFCLSVFAFLLFLGLLCRTRPRCWRWSIAAATSPATRSDRALAAVAAATPLPGDMSTAVRWRSCQRCGASRRYDKNGFFSTHFLFRYK